MSYKISDLEKYDEANLGMSLLASNGSSTNRLTIDSIVKLVKSSLGYDRVLEKCTHCGQWGAVMCSCPNCGAPIDPKEGL